MTLKNVLVATDFGDASMAALSWAFDMAAPLGAKVHLIHVFQEDAGLRPADALAALKKLGDAYAESPSFGSYTALRGETAGTIVEFALTSQADLLVIGLNGGLGANSELLGGRAESVLRNARCPVVVVRPSELELLARAEEHRRSRSVR
jgi:nucleotide-binding universal stress UspA family protein